MRLTAEPRFTWAPACGSEEMTKPFGILLLNNSLVVPRIKGLFVMRALAASGVKPTRDAMVKRSAPFETINVTDPPESIRPPACGSDSIMVPAATSSSNRFSVITLVIPKGVRSESA